MQTLITDKADSSAVFWRPAAVGGRRSFFGVLVVVMGAVLIVAGCDSGAPTDSDLLVVESFAETEQGLPTIVVRRTLPLDVPYPNAPVVYVSDAEVTVDVDNEPVSYRPDPSRPGHYVPVDSVWIPARSRYAVEVLWQGERARASDVLPPRIRLDTVITKPSAHPVKAVFADSIALTDSLTLNVREGYIYLVEATVYWRAEFPEVGADSLFWVRARLRPPSAFPSAVIDLFLRTDQIQRERLVEQTPDGRHVWRGVYAVPVEGPDAPLPPHTLGVAVLRSGTAYARYASSRDAPDRREPVTNVTGGLGIVAGVSVDSRSVRVGD